MILGASHGFLKDGFQTLVTNEYNFASDYYELIEVERQIRKASQENPNLYTLVHYAACRVAISDSPGYKLVYHNHMAGRGGPGDNSEQNPI